MTDRMRMILKWWIICTLGLIGVHAVVTLILLALGRPIQLSASSVILQLIGAVLVGLMLSFIYVSKEGYGRTQTLSRKIVVAVAIVVGLVLVTISLVLVYA